ncbi:TadE/TadG family type IV pilus assembly protein [Sphingomonas sp. KR3-1]|uniref:TadE/TadG family type IV pilus assembly protein n=1 Tax=Sphingomonas sp. KR3-1 TaxID=3156611 RepID=UPI0032B4A891
MREGRGKVVAARAFLSKLARDTRANTLAIMGMALIPLAGMVGGGIDISRMYIVKTRLQHACDAGALAGRKSMGGGTWTQTLNGVANYPQVTAAQFFESNYNSAAYGASNVTKSFTESAGKVSGTASATLPMTLMRLFGKTTETLTVTCDAEMRLPNTDVMFVLDNTGSMDWCPNGDTSTCSGKTTSRIGQLRIAVKCFYQIVARLDIPDVDCDGDEPSGGTGDQVQIRFGFVPYSVNVNVGRLLPASYMPSTWQYQTRQLVSVAYPSNGNASQTSSNTTSDVGAWIPKNYTVTRSSSNASDSWCKSNAPSSTTTNGTTTQTTLSTTEYPGYRTVTYKTDAPSTKREYQYNSFSGKVCYFDTRDTVTTTTKTYTRNDTAQATWKYGPMDVDISAFKTGASSIQMRIGNNGAMKTVTWNGCIEERRTITGTSFDPIPTGATDLDIATAPTGDSQTQWKPSLGDVEYMRRNSSNNYTRDPIPSSTTNFAQPDDYCPSEAHKMEAWTPQAFDDYVDGLTPVGNTYHDIGLLWGARLMWPTGIFRSENEFTPKGGEIQRHIIFMTDGDTQTSSANYAAYGLPWYDLRNVASGDLGTSPATFDLDDEVNARFLALCKTISSNNITLWVIAFGTSTSQATKDRLTKCASFGGGHYFTADDGPKLQQTFKSIADQISQLRLTK